MTQPMVETLRMEIARVEVSLFSCDPPHGTHKLIKYHGGKYYPAAQEFVYLRAKITNLSCTLSLHLKKMSLTRFYKAMPQVFTIDLEVEPAEHVVYEGVLTDLAVGQLGEGESKELETALCFIAYGHFDISAQVRVFDASRVDTRAGLGRIIAIVQNDNEV
jgi:hypothetical protein